MFQIVFISLLIVALLFLDLEKICTVLYQSFEDKLQNEPISVTKYLLDASKIGGTIKPDCLLQTGR